MPTERFPKRLIYTAEPVQIVAWLRRIVELGIDRIELYDDRSDRSTPKSLPRHWIEQPD